jgi:hypothetical protein
MGLPIAGGGEKLNWTMRATHLQPDGGINFRETILADFNPPWIAQNAELATSPGNIAGRGRLWPVGFNPISTRW